LRAASTELRSTPTRLASAQDAEDLLQETLLAVWRDLEQFEGRASIRREAGIARPYAPFVLALEGDWISAITWFGESGVFPLFGLAPALS